MLGGINIIEKAINIYIYMININERRDTWRVSDVLGEDNTSTRDDAIASISSKLTDVITSDLTCLGLDLFEDGLAP